MAGGGKQPGERISHLPLPGKRVPSTRQSGGIAQANEMPRGTGVCRSLATHPGETTSVLPLHLCWLASQPAACGGMTVYSSPRLVCTPSTSIACGCCTLILSRLPVKPPCVRAESRKLKAAVVGTHTTVFL